MTDVNRIDAAGQAAPDPTPIPVGLDEIAQEPPEPDDSPAKDPPKPSDAQLILRYMPHAIIVVDNKRLYVNRPDSGLWNPLNGARAESVHGTMHWLIAASRRAAGLDSASRSITARAIMDCVSLLNIAIVGERMPGLKRVRQHDLDSLPILPLKGGGGVDLRNGDCIAPGPDFAGLLLTDDDERSAGVEYQPEILRQGIPEAAKTLEHYGRGLFRRLARHLLRTDKSIDTVRIARSNAGKTTLADALEAALPGIAMVADAPGSFTPQGLKFSGPATLLATRRLVIFDEADKIEKPPPPSATNALTARRVRIEEKNLQPYYALRTANAVMLGADWPALVTAQGSDTRFNWAYNPDLPLLPIGLRDWLLSTEGCAWLATLLIAFAMDIYAKHYSDEEDDSQYQLAAREMLEANTDPVVRALKEAFQAGEPADFVCNAAIKNALREAEVDDFPTNNRAFGRACREAWPNATPGQKICHCAGCEGERKKGLYGIKPIA